MRLERFIALVLLAALAWWSPAAVAQTQSTYAVGQAIDSLNGVPVFYNGEVSHVSARNVAPDGYNLGLQYQCVEFVKRYYYAHLDHLMPDSYGHAKDFFDARLKDGQVSVARALIQHTNPSSTKPRPDDLLIYRATLEEPYGHVAIIAAVIGDTIEIIQQNPGPDKPSRERYSIVLSEDRWHIGNERIQGWLRKEVPVEHLPE